MDLVKQYIVQSLAAASNNLRLTSYQLEVVAMLREAIINSDDVAEDITKMKKMTQFSTLAIRLNEIYNYLTQERIDFLKFSDKFKEHSQYLINDLNHLLETDNTVGLKNAIRKLKGEVVYDENGQSEEISVELSNNKTDSDQLIVDKTVEPEQETEPAETVENGMDEEAMKSFEAMILKPIKAVDTLLHKLASDDINYEDLSRFAEIMSVNGEIAEKNGFEIISNMHKIISRALVLIKSRDIMPGKDVIEAMRACLIVIVAVVKGKDVDITKYLNKAEDFGREINALNKREEV